MRILCVGGDWGDKPKESGLFRKIVEELPQALEPGYGISMYNGGSMSELQDIVDNKIKDVDVVLWFASVSNSEEKIVNQIKENNQKVILVTSKRDNSEYSFQELVAHALSVKANLTVSFSKIKDESNIQMSLYDPLGNVWAYCTSDYKFLTKQLGLRLNQLVKFTREGLFRVYDDNIQIPNDKEFFKYIRRSARKFHKLIVPANGVKRYLGNASFRCTKGGFPSMKFLGQVFVSKRNINKKDIGKNGFVRVWHDGEKTKYYGTEKPSVDTPIQVRLYNYYDLARYMIHSHTYLENPTVVTSTVIPCGALEEFDEIIKLMPSRDAINFGINLKGHGSLIIASSVEAMKRFKHIARPIAERQYISKDNKA